MSHTPGPWSYLAEEQTVELDDTHDIYRFWSVIDADKHLICDTATNEDDARLIAAAPMLLKALEYVLRVRNIQCTSHPAGDLSCAKCQADLAIREATGGAQ